MALEGGESGELDASSRGFLKLIIPDITKTSSNNCLEVDVHTCLESPSKLDFL